MKTTYFIASLGFISVLGNTSATTELQSTAASLDAVKQQILIYDQDLATHMENGQNLSSIRDLFEESREELLRINAHHQTTEQTYESDRDKNLWAHIAERMKKLLLNLDAFEGYIDFVMNQGGDQLPVRADILYRMIQCPRSLDSSSYQAPGKFFAKYGLPVPQGIYPFDIQNVLPLLRSAGYAILQNVIIDIENGQNLNAENFAEILESCAKHFQNLHESDPEQSPTGYTYLFSLKMAYSEKLSNFLEDINALDAKFEQENATTQRETLHTLVQNMQPLVYPFFALTRW